MNSPQSSSLMPIFHPSPARGADMAYLSPHRGSSSPPTRDTTPVHMAPPGVSMFEDPADRAPVMASTLDVADADSGYEDTWVTAFGFPCDNSNALAAVLAEFQACGTIQHWVVGPQANCNWMHLKFESVLSAQRALQRNGTRLGTLNMMVGVQPPSQAERDYIAQHVGNTWSASSMNSTLPLRPYVLTSSSKMAPVPKPEKRWTQHIAELVFGS